MSWLDIFKGKKKVEVINTPTITETEVVVKNDFKFVSDEYHKYKVFSEIPGLSYRNIMTVSFNGEKNLGDVGPALNYTNDYVMLRVRSWQAQYDSDIAQIAVKRLVSWTIGKGLKLQSEPKDYIIEQEGIKFDKKKFQKDVEQRFDLFRKSKCDYAGLLNLNQLSKEAEKNAIVGGDVLVVLRLIKDKVTIQLIDGSQIQSPFYGSEYYPQALANGNKIIDGVEVNDRGEHIAFYVKTYAVKGDMQDLFSYTFERIEAKGKKSGLQMAYLYYGDKTRITNTRGIPLLSACLSKIAKLDRYTEAALGQAEEAAKVSYQVVHHLNAEGKAPFTKSIVEGFDLERGNSLPVTDDGVQLKKEIQVTTQKTAFNNPPGSEIKVLDNKNPLYYKDFYEKNSNTLYAVFELPPAVATGEYTDSFSASRAAIKDWSHTLEIKREHHAVGFLKPIFDFWLEVKIFLGTITAPGYYTAKAEDNDDVLESYRNVRYVGSQVPHIDPVKEAQAARLILGSAGGSLPLNDLETVTEQLGGGDSYENIIQFADEIKMAQGLGIKPEVINPQGDTAKEKSKKKDAEEDDESED